MRIATLNLLVRLVVTGLVAMQLPAWGQPSNDDLLRSLDDPSRQQPAAKSPKPAASDTDPFKLLESPPATASQPSLGQDLVDNLSFKLIGRLSTFFDRPTPREDLDDKPMELETRLETKTRLTRGHHQLATDVWLSIGSQEDTYSQQDYYFDVDAADPTIERQRRYFELNELYWIGSWGHVDVTVGKKRFNLGTAPIYSPNDRINRIDLTDPLDPLKYGVWQGAIDYYRGNTTFTLAFLPFFLPPKIPGDKSRWLATQESAVGTLFPGDFQFFEAPLVLAEDLPEGVDEMQLLGRIKTTLQGWDLFVAATTTISPYPVLRNDSLNPAEILSVREYMRATTLGMGFSTTFANLEVHGEAFIQWSDDNKDDDYVAGIIGFTYTFDDAVQSFGLNRLEITIDYAGEEVFHHQRGAQYLASSSLARIGQNDLITLLNVEVTDDFNARVLGHFDLDDEGNFVSPIIRYRPIEGLWLRLSAEIFSGPSDSFYGRWNKNDRLLFAMEYSF